MSDAIFRKEKLPNLVDFKITTEGLITNFRSHDNGVPRAREYSLKSVIHFSIFQGMTIQEIIEEDFDYFLWFGRKIKNFTYDSKVIDYGEKCLKQIELFDSDKLTNFPHLKYAYKQVSVMLDYEYYLDTNIDPLLKDAYQSMVDVNFYKTIFNRPIEKLIRQNLTKHNYSPEFRRKYFEEIKLYSVQNGFNAL